MSLKICPRCEQELIFLNGKLYCVCSFCDETGKFKTNQLNLSFNNKRTSRAIPFKIEARGSQFPKIVKHNRIGVTVGDLIKDPMGRLVFLETQDNEQRFCFTVKFLDGTQKVVEGSGANLQVNFFIWWWRINNQKSENDYVTFGLDFSKLKKEMHISESKIKKSLGFNKLPSSSSREAYQLIKFEKELMKFLKLEIQRYFKEQKNIIILLEEPTPGGIKIYSLNKGSLIGDLAKAFIGVAALISILGVSMIMSTTPEPVSESRPSSSFESSDYSDYIDSLSERAGVGATIDSKEEIIRSCMVILQDQGFSYSQAYDQCY